MMIRLILIVLGVLMAVTHNTPGDLVVGTLLAVIGVALWIGLKVNRIRLL